MEQLIQLIGQILAPISPGLLAAVLVAGLIFSFIYIYQLNVTSEDIFHILMGGWVFIFAVFVFRFIVFTTGGPAPGFAGWLGIAILWATYCGAMDMGRRIIKKIQKLRNS